MTPRDEMEIAWVHLPDHAPEPLSDREREFLQNAVRLQRTRHSMGRRFGSVFHHALSICMEAASWSRGRSHWDWISLPEGDFKPLEPLLRERLEWIIWALRSHDHKALAGHLSAMLEEAGQVLAMIEPSSPTGGDQTKVVDLVREAEKRRPIK